MSIAATEKRIHQVFVVSVILKGLNALLELVSGILLLFTGVVANAIAFLIQQELIEDPTDFFATRVRALLPTLASHGQLFAALYLLSHGIVKAFLVWGLLKNKSWVYPMSVAVLSIFILSQVVRFFMTHSVALLLLTLFDIFLLWLIWHEYRRMPLRVA